MSTEHFCLLHDITWTTGHDDGCPVCQVTAELKAANEKVLRVVRGEFKQICSYCGWETSDGNKWEELQQHIAVCPKHPMRAVEEKAEKFLKALDTAYTLLRSLATNLQGKGKILRKTDTYMAHSCDDLVRIITEYLAKQALAPAEPVKLTMQERPRIVCLCGSTRFKDAFDEANYRETMAGKIVLSVGFFMHASGNRHGQDVGATPEQKVALDKLHKRKIDLADEVLILNVGGYIGESTRSELEYAKAHGKPIQFWEPDRNWKPGKQVKV